MTLCFHKLTTPFLCLVLLGVLSGCSGLEGVFFPLEDLAREAYLDLPDSHRSGKNYYEPVILIANEKILIIRYLSVGPNAEHEQVTQLISDHCNGAYIETNRLELRGYTTVDAECIHGTDSIQ